MEHFSSMLGPTSTASPTATSVLTVDSSGPDEYDSVTDSVSITASIIDYEFENGRRYHAYKAGYYPLPNDEKERDRLDMQYTLTMLAMDGELYFAPIQDPQRILDVGTGTGIWAMQMADKFPKATIIGTDLSPIQPELVPQNVHFEINDCEGPWLFQEDHFDFIHMRWMIGSISDWQEAVKKAYRHLKPGGYLEIQELDPRLASDDGTVTSASFHKQFTDYICEASETYGKAVPLLSHYSPILQVAGFKDIRERIIKIPINVWPKNKKLKKLGMFQFMNYFEGYEGIAVALFTRALGWTYDEFQVFLAKVRQELKDPNVHAYQNFGVFYGRKPMSAETGNG